MKQLIFAAAMSIACLDVYAAPENFTVKSPAWTNLAACDNVIVHKSPSASSPKLVYNFDKMVHMNPYTSARWISGRPTGGDEYLYMDGYTPILSEKDGWYEIHDTGLDENVWVKAPCMSPQEILAGHHNADNFQWIDSPGDPAGGNYAIFLSADSLHGGGCIYLGRLIDGMIVCPYSIWYSIGEFGLGDTITFGDTEFKIKSGLLTDYDVLKLSSLTDRMLDAIWTGATKMDKPVVIYSSPSGDYHMTEYVGE